LDDPKSLKNAALRVKKKENFGPDGKQVHFQRRVLGRAQARPEKGGGELGCQEKG